MSLVVSNEGEKYLLDQAIIYGAEDLVLKLFTNDYTPVATSTSGSFTEATFGGYAAKTLSKGTWTTPATNANGKGETQYDTTDSGVTQTWTSTSSQTIYGYYIENSVSGDLVWAERFGSERPLANGDKLNIKPKLSLSSEN